ncbi:MAG: GGDEF domain-containing protein [Planctomycetota bacterium]|nr:GGDEF domain-containing protein [Planctomycetota bacterium]
MTSLTGLFNRRYAHQQLKRELSRSQRYNDPLCVLMVDIDHFKNVNDTYGHSVGDAVLAELARLFYDCLRSTDVACRYGGEEFLIILPCTSTTQGKVVARRILSAVDSTSFREKKEDIPLTVSIGLTATGEDFTLHFQELIRQADIAMYKSKSAGRNRLCVYSSSDREEFIEIFTFQPEDRLEKLSYKIVELRSSLRDTAISTIQSLVNAIGTRGTPT